MRRGEMPRSGRADSRGGRTHRRYETSLARPASSWPEAEVADCHHEGVVRPLAVVGQDAFADHLSRTGKIEGVREDSCDPVGGQDENVARPHVESRGVKRRQLVAGNSPSKRERALAPSRRRGTAEHSPLDVPNPDPGGRAFGSRDERYADRRPTTAL